MLLLTYIFPSCLSISSLTIHIPKPVPVPSLVVKNASRILWDVSRDIPLPVSATVIRKPLLARLLQSGEDAARILIFPGPAIDSIELLMRFISTCCISPGEQEN